MKTSKEFSSLLSELNSPIAADLITSTKNEEGDFLHLRSGYITYLKPDKIALVEEKKIKKWDSRNRVRIKPAKAARKFVEGEYTDEQYEEFHNELNSYAFSVRQLALVRGRFIPKIYNDLYDKRKQSRGMQSRMTDAKPDKFMLYSENPHQVGLLTLWDHFKGDDVVIARALLWKTTTGLYLDRIYGADLARPFLARYARNKGWKLHGDENLGKLEVLVDNIPPHGNFPYLDTFYVQKDRLVSE